MDRQLKQRAASLPKTTQPGRQRGVHGPALAYHERRGPGVRCLITSCTVSKSYMTYLLVVSTSADHDLTLEEFCEVYDAIMMTNDEWMQES